MIAALRHPWISLALGLLLGGGIVHTGWVLRSGGKPGRSDSHEPASQSVNARRLPAEAHPRGDGRIGEKASALAAKDPREAWRQSLEIGDFEERSAFLLRQRLDAGVGPA